MIERQLQLQCMLVNWIINFCLKIATAQYRCGVAHWNHKTLQKLDRLSYLTDLVLQRSPEQHLITGRSLATSVIDYKWQRRTLPL